ncbi:MAG: efflux RND transporter permease subunit, partial [Candidatus Hydrogenedentes bacterium]|nr:efflux RND transporter permease subunit [Candidatus Hydrogenedentota bacterium]
RLEETETRARKFEEIIRTTPEVDTVTVEIGRERRSMESDRGENVAEFTVLLKAPDLMEMQQDEVIESLRKKILIAATDESIAFTMPTLFSFRSAIEIQIVGNSLDELRHFGQAAIQTLSRIKGLTDIELSIRPGYPELIIEMDRDLLTARGLSPGQVAKRLRAEIQGEVATRFSRGADRVDIRVRANQQVLRGIDDLRNLSVTDGPTPIPLADVARIRVEEGPSEIRRISQRRTAIVSANVEGRDLASVSRDIDDQLSKLNMPPEMYYIQGGQRRELDTAFTSLQFALLLALFLVYVVMACQFESIIQPALVMCAVPLAFIGVIYALLITGTNISVMVFLGGIILTGIVVNDAIILVDYINQLRTRGMSKVDAIVEAGKTRLRPIIMTTVTSVLGLAPMLLASGEGAEMRRPMALTIVSGLTMATILTLFIIPMAYNLFGGKDRS